MWKERIRVDKLSPAWTEVKMNTATDRNNRNLIIWLGGVCLVIYCMIVVGGVTRLTQSGLSMVDWQPIMGVIPPVTAEEWQQTFDE